MRRNAFGGRFQSIKEMDEFLIDQWNATVASGDTVYHLGNLSFKPHTIEEILPKLNGNIILIVGNHDPFFKSMHGQKAANSRCDFRHTDCHQQEIRS